jgi:YfiH family protein
VICLRPDWPAPANVYALCSTREGGVSQEPYSTLNLADHVGDDAAAVAENRLRLGAVLPPGASVCWLQQVHGKQVVAADLVDAPPEADASVSRTAGQVCAVLTADCLPVLFASTGGNEVGAAHAGWRGLLDGVLEATIAAMHGAPESLLAWLGPAIGPTAFEVGPEVREAFLERAGAAEAPTAACFRDAPGRAGHSHADLYSLARIRLAAAGITRIYGGECCTFREAGRFYSYRRDGVTGRMASVIGFTA